MTRPSPPNLTIIESPYSGDTQTHILYARLCLRDSFHRRETPMAAHLLYTQALHDNLSVDRERGMNAAERFYHHAHQVVIYADLGISDGMRHGMALAAYIGIPTTTRHLFPTSIPQSEKLSLIRKNSLTLPRDFDTP